VSVKKLRGAIMLVKKSAVEKCVCVNFWRSTSSCGHSNNFVHFVLDKVQTVVDFWLAPFFFIRHLTTIILILNDYVLILPVVIFASLALFVQFLIRILLLPAATFPPGFIWSSQRFFV
jgi:hypothetical protein